MANPLLFKILLREEEMDKRGKFKLNLKVIVI